MTPSVSVALPKSLHQTVDPIPSNELAEGNVFKELRGRIISTHLKSEQTFLTGLCEVKVHFQPTFRQIFINSIFDKILWKKIAVIVRDLALFTLTLVGLYFLFEEAKTQLEWIGNHKISWHLSEDYKYFSVFSQADYNRRFLPSALFLISALGLILFKLKQRVVDIFSHSENRIQQLKASYNHFQITTKATRCFELGVSNLLNQRIEGPQESWQDPITFTALNKQKILSPATLIIRNMAFSLDAAIIILFFRDTDETKYPEFVPAEPKLVLAHPTDRDRLDDVEQQSVVQQICDTFLITPSEFSSCWDIQESAVPKTDYFDVERWYSSTNKLPEDLTRGLIEKPDDKELRMAVQKVVLEGVKKQYQVEYASFLASERGAYMQMMRFNNFSKLVPPEVAVDLERGLPEGLAEKLSRIRAKENA